MDPKDLRTLELPIVLERLAQLTDFSASRQLALDLAPTTYVEIAHQLQAETTEARQLLAGDGKLTVGGARDVRSEVEAAGRGSVLEPQELLDIQATLISARTLARRFKKEEETYPVLSRIAADLSEETELIDSISRTVDDRGQVRDGASKKLGSVRRNLRSARERVTKKLESMVSDPKVVSMLQEPIVTQREGRSVIPLKAEFKGKMEAVIHDQSTSGATLFVEPLPVVELNNEVRELELEERAEVRRILKKLSEAVGGKSDEVVVTVEALAILDLAFAKARYAEAIDATEPALRDLDHSGSRLSLERARHPLLDPDTVVPIDLVLEREVQALVITGPNTGGKTVTLKTAGLLAAMAQCGMHVPAAPGAELGMFRAIFADIGDEQSLEQSLSTFSSHISNIVRILGSADGASLVLLDELGAGTDPGEGAALAQALLAEFVERGAVTLVATHFPELKLYAHQKAGVRNASVEFDVESLRPTYRLRIGLPGRSNALAIAERLGLDPSLIGRARERISLEDQQEDSLLEEIRHQRDEAEEARSSAQEASAEARLLRDELRERLDRIEDERLEILEAARRQAIAQTEELSKEVDRLRLKLAAAGAALDPVSEVEQELEEVESALEPAVVERGQDVEQLEDLKVGDYVHLRTIDADGVVTALQRGKVEVQVGRLRVQARLAELGPPTELPVRDQATSDSVGLRVRNEAPPMELYVRGQTVEEALEALERRLDAAYLAGMPSLRVVHGKGSGTLRRAIREELSRSPYISSFRPGEPSEGGEGVTVAELAEN
ncbi:MAG: endonuclease MutS2 [Anaerolineae bacterium]|nr:MAG: endonuclease MutS2 [Anaerolineae bacterium]